MVASQLQVRVLLPRPIMFYKIWMEGGKFHVDFEVDPWRKIYLPEEKKMLYQVAVTEPALVDTESKQVREEQIVLDVTSVLADNIESAKTQAILLAAKATAASGMTDPKRWSVHVRPFL